MHMFFSLCLQYIKGLQKDVRDFIVTGAKFVEYLSWNCT